MTRAPQPLQVTPPPRPRSWTDPLDLNAGWLTGLVDLNTEREDVQQRIADYLTSLLSIGFSGFRFDAAKHIQPDDHVAILSKLRANLGGGPLPDDFIVWMEVLTGGEGDMLVCNNASGYNYGGYLAQALLDAGFPQVRRMGWWWWWGGGPRLLSAVRRTSLRRGVQSDVDKIKIWASYYPKEPGLDCGSISMVRKAIQNDDAGEGTLVRGSGGGG
jgi:alpha-amylase